MEFTTKFWRIIAITWRDLITPMMYLSGSFAVMMKTTYNIFKDRLFQIILLTSILTGCQMADISQPLYEKNESSALIAHQKLQHVVERQGFNVMAEEGVYQLKLTDHWPGLIGQIAKLWPDQRSTLSAQYNFNTFDGRIRFEDGKSKGETIGLQSWHYYERINPLDVIKINETNDLNKQAFGLVVLHYFIELPFRLLNAPYKRYYGQRIKNGITYDILFISWEDGKVSSQYDQYILWINTKTQLIDYCVYTLHDNQKPLTRHKYGSIAFLDYRNIHGMMVPFQMPIMLDDGIILEDAPYNYFHQFSIQSFQFGGFNEHLLYPFDHLEKQIDSK